MNRYDALIAALTIVAILILTLTAMALGYDTVALSLALTMLGSIASGGILYRVGRRKGGKCEPKT